MSARVYTWPRNLSLLNWATEGRLDGWPENMQTMLPIGWGPELSFSVQANSEKTTAAAEQNVDRLVSACNTWCDEGRRWAIAWWPMSGVYAGSLTHRIDQWCGGTTSGDIGKLKSVVGTAGPDVTAATTFHTAVAAGLAAEGIMLDRLILDYENSPGWFALKGRLGEARATSEIALVLDGDTQSSNLTAELNQLVAIHTSSGAGVAGDIRDGVGDARETWDHAMRLLANAKLQEACVTPMQGVISATVPAADYGAISLGREVEGPDGMVSHHFKSAISSKFQTPISYVKEAEQFAKPPWWIGLLHQINIVRAIANDDTQDIDGLDIAPWVAGNFGISLDPSPDDIDITRELLKHFAAMGVSNFLGFADDADLMQDLAEQATTLVPATSITRNLPDVPLSSESVSTGDVLTTLSGVLPGFEPTSDDFFETLRSAGCSFLAKMNVQSATDPVPNEGDVIVADGTISTDLRVRRMGPFSASNPAENLCVASGGTPGAAPNVNAGTIEWPGFTSLTRPFSLWALIRPVTKDGGNVSDDVSWVAYASDATGMPTDAFHLFQNFGDLIFRADMNGAVQQKKLGSNFIGEFLNKWALVAFRWDESDAVKGWVNGIEIPLSGATRSTNPPDTAGLSFNRGKQVSNNTAGRYLHYGSGLAGLAIRDGDHETVAPTDDTLVRRVFESLRSRHVSLIDSPPTAPEIVTAINTAGVRVTGNLELTGGFTSPLGG